MKPYRTSYEIIKEILEALPELPSRIMMKVNLQWARLVTYLNRLEQQGLIEIPVTERRRTKQYYQITNKGIDYLESVNEILILQQECQTVKA